MDRRLVQTIAFVAVALTLTGCQRRQERAAARAVQSIQQHLAASQPPGYVTANDQVARLWRTERRFYERHAYQPVWVFKGRPRHEAADLIAAIEAARADGLDPADYDLQALAALRTEKSRNPFKRDSVKPEQVAEADLRLTFMFLKLASHLLSGRVDPEDVDPHWFGQPRKVDLAGVVDRALNESGVQATLQDLTPRHEQYSLLKRLLQQYRDIAAKGGWPTNSPARLSLKPGTRGPAVAALRRRLAVTGDLPAGSAAASDVADKALVEGLKRFERRHEMPADGVMDAKVAAALNVPVEQRIQQIELNLERWRWLPESFGDRYIVVNVPTFTLVGVEGGRTVLVMRVVAGEKENPTPIFSDTMTTIVFSPYWNIPSTIARKETIPAVLRDPGYLKRNNLEIVRNSRVVDPATVDWNDDDPDFRIRQRPGGRNSLGRVKFVFPNHFDVYLHDTPADSLFERVQRDFSHGCVRVEKPRELAQWLLGDQPEWTPARIDAAMNAGVERHVALKRPVPVYILYQTVWVDGDGTAHFPEDIYGHDARQLSLLSPVPAPSPAVRMARS
jgi:murein L,D-transpeptidase YcbB/YkuD